MAADIGQDAAVARSVPEPGRTARCVQPVRGKVDGLEHLADRAGLDQLACAYRRAHFEAFGIEDRELAARFAHCLTYSGELLQAGDTGLVGQTIFARAHDPNAQWCA